MYTFRLGDLFLRTVSAVTEFNDRRR